ncbi:hypothetical protein DSO57_1001517 [Entomophthora muscae]|uniref:Uncharacterized protein n=1 Tax=Entomophthora muscae TaxID=34485 RepID=A0ACC2UTV0_9FUNG|nr:hypothetical protein DSO57_1001517 [Entomophthora muscae]
MSSKLLQHLSKPWKLGDLELKNRVVFASLTRNRNLVPGQVNVDYYAQRATAGLILSEGVLIEPQGTEWPEAPGIWSDKQISGWKKVTDAVHEKGGAIFAQLWHLGRAANTLHNAGVPPPAPSAIRAKAGKFRLLVGTPEYSEPEAIEDPKEYIQKFKQAAINAKEAGFDGVELHSANGYLAHQFLECQSNQRTDQYGGSIENRCRFVLEIIDAFNEVFPSQKVGIKLSPCGGFNDMGDKDVEDTKQLCKYLVTELDKRDIGYIQLFRHLAQFDTASRGNPFDLEFLVPYAKQTQIMFNGGFTAKEADDFIAEGKASSISFGRPFIANPDLVYRFFNDLDLADPINFPSLYLYEGTNKHLGYSDYPNHPNH